MSLEVLIIDPDEGWLEKVAGNLQKEGSYSVDMASKGALAQNLIAKKDYFAILLSFETQDHSGLQVLKFILKNKINHKVFFLFKDDSAFTEGIVEKKKLLKMGVMEVHVGPFTEGFFPNLLESYQNLSQVVKNLPKKSGVSDEEELEKADGEFTKVEVSKFYSAKKVLFDVYVRLSENHYVKILHAGDDFCKDRIDNYRKKNMKYLYFHKNDRRKYVMFMNQLANKVVKSKKTDSKSKAKVLGLVAENFLEDAYTVGLKPQVISQAKEICNQVYKVIKSEKSLFKLMRELHDFDPSLYTHSFLLTFFAGSIINQFQWKTQNTIETMAMACMFHDIGKIQFPKDLLEKTPEEMTENELEFYYEHPLLSSDMIEGCPRINRTVQQIVEQHHETHNGIGFPNKLKGGEVLTLANILCLVDDFVHMMEREKLRPTDALLKLIRDKNMVYRYKTEIVEGFMKTFADPAKIKKEYRLPMNSKIVSSKKAS